jgi:hypothetical protein
VAIERLSGIGQRDLLVGRSQHLLLHRGKLGHLLVELDKLLFEPVRLERKRLRRFLPVNRIELAQIARHALLQLGPAPCHLRAREVPIPVVHSFELAAVDDNARLRQQAHPAAQLDELCAHLAQRRTVVLPEVGDRLVVGCKAPQQPQKLQIAPGLALEPAARLYAVEIAVDVELQENRGVEGRPAGSCRLNTVEPEVGEIERIDKGVYCANRVLLVDPIVQALGQKCRLASISSIDEPLHDHPPKNHQGNHSHAGLFTHPGSPSSSSSRSMTAVSSKLRIARR